MDAERPGKRTRSSVACNRCKERRQKCDNATTQCSNCKKAQVACEYKGGEHPQWYVESLEERVRQLESSLASSSRADTSQPITPESGMNGPDWTNETTASMDDYGATTLDEQASPSQPTKTVSVSPTNLGDAIGFLALCAAAEPYYVGSSTGYSLANMVQAAVQDSRPVSGERDLPSPVGSTPTDNAMHHLPMGEDRPFSCHRPRKTTKPATMPSDELGSALLQAYLDQIQPFYPFLDRRKLEDLHRQRFELTATSAHLAKLHFVYGIGARRLQLARRSSHSIQHNLPEEHFVSGTAQLSSALELRSLDSIEIILLLAIYVLHSPSGPGVWQLTGTAMRMCVEFGLHRNSKGVQSPSVETRQRLFWSCLILERKVAVVLGRPFSLHDVDIAVEIPLDVPITYLAQLQGIISRIQYSGIRLNSTPNLAELAMIKIDLANWRATLPLGNESLELEYHKTLLLALQPYVMSSGRTPEIIKECAEAAGAVCRLQKAIHQRNPTAFYLLELHDVLVAGITLIYCLWISRGTSNTFSALADLGACSTILFLVAEQWESAKRYRDFFEVLVQATTKYLSQQPDTAAQPNNPLLPLDVQGIDLAQLWADEDASWRWMLGEFTGAADVSTEDDWTWAVTS